MENWWRLRKRGAGDVVGARMYTTSGGVTRIEWRGHGAVAALDEVGLIQGRPDGTKRMISLRLDAIKKHYPGLLDLIRAAP